MLTIKQNLLETIKGGKPDRFVNSYEYLELMWAAPVLGAACGVPGQIVKNQWGVTMQWPEGQPGAFPVHGDDKVIKDIENWKDYITMPNVTYSDGDWAPAVAHANSVDRNEKFVTAVYFYGVFEQTHFMMGMEDALMAFYEEPEAMHELIDFIVEHEIATAKEYFKYIKPDALFHHDDWGSQLSTFLSPEMFEEFLLPAYKKLYGFWKDNGVEIIVHHADCYAATLVPFMIEMGIDIWQGVMSSNNIPELVEKYGEQITFMGGIDDGKIDRAEWTPELVAAEVEKVCRENVTKFFIPGMTSGTPASVFENVNVTVAQEIDRMSRELF
ncbi:uroporphyrinogen decarboxylase family protein [Eubacteriaceae bacterium ES2]|nr:uroporphyrinogen decarboxylase family protein [Eubacteriaceae bacterium ES2]